MIYLDPLNCPITPGCKVLTHSTDNVTRLSLIANVKKVNKDWVYINYTSRSNKITTITRSHKQVVVIDDQVKQNNIKYPEYQL